MDCNKETISRLKFIGRIQIGDKVNLKDMYIQSDGIITQITRILNQDNRNKTLVFIQDTIVKTFEILTCYEKSKKNSDKIMCSNLIKDLKACKNGLLNLKETYISDIKFVCDIDVILQTIDAKLCEIDSSVFLSLTPPNAPPPFPSHLSQRDEEDGDDI